MYLQFCAMHVCAEGLVFMPLEGVELRLESPPTPRACLARVLCQSPFLALKCSSIAHI